MKPQTALIRDHLLSVGTISGMEAAGMYKVRHLPARIWELKHQYGLKITAINKRDKTLQRYVRYVLTSHVASERSPVTGGVYA